jgi:AraC family transcriptional regulator, regulatory protein of adaptative response / methylated-DNA-[protein]-cysteine methyltransferase
MVSKLATIRGNMNIVPTDECTDDRWQRILERDKSKDGQFWYSVATTGVYCRPSCPSRHALRKNVSIHDTLEDARATGARGCKRCNPDGCSTDTENAAIIEQACRMIEASEVAPTLRELADRAELSPSYFHRLFKTVTGVTPKGYAASYRAERMRTELAEAGTVTEAIYAAGFGSSSRFYDQSSKRLGMTPSQYKAGGADEVLHFAVGECSLNAILVAMSERGVAAILLGDEPDSLVRMLQDQFPRAELVGGDTDFEAYVAQVVGLVESPGSAFDLPLDIRGTAFQQRVWRALREIPMGDTASYSDVAQAIGSPTSVRAVAAACGANRHAIAIPCHRVVRSDGSLSGYRWGVERKRALLRHEATS